MKIPTGPPTNPPTAAPVPATTPPFTDSLIVTLMCFASQIF